MVFFKGKKHRGKMSVSAQFLKNSKQGVLLPYLHQYKEHMKILMLVNEADLRFYISHKVLVMLLLFVCGPRFIEQAIHYLRAKVCWVSKESHYNHDEWSTDTCFGLFS